MIDIKTLWKTRKKMIISITAGVTAAAIGCGIWYQVGHTRSDPVYVYPFCPDGGDDGSRVLRKIHRFT